MGHGLYPAFSPLYPVSALLGVHPGAFSQGAVAAAVSLADEHRRGYAQGGLQQPQGLGLAALGRQPAGVGSAEVGERVKAGGGQGQAMDPLRVQERIALGELGPAREAEQVELPAVDAGALSEVRQQGVEGLVRPDPAPSVSQSQPLVIGKLLASKERRHHHPVQPRRHCGKGLGVGPGIAGDAVNADQDAGGRIDCRWAVEVVNLPADLYPPYPACVWDSISESLPAGDRRKVGAVGGVRT